MRCRYGIGHKREVLLKSSSVPVLFIPLTVLISSALGSLNLLPYPDRQTQEFLRSGIVMTSWNKRFSVMITFHLQHFPEKTGIEYWMYVSSHSVKLDSNLSSLAMQLRTTKQLLGRAGERFLLFGLLCYSKEGKLCLEDTEGKVELNFSQLVRRLPRYKAVNI